MRTVLLHSWIPVVSLVASIFAVAAPAQPRPRPAPFAPLPPAQAAGLRQPADELPQPFDLPETAAAIPPTPAEVRTVTAKLFQDSMAGHLKANCFRCHGNAKSEAKLNLEALPPDFLSDDSAEKWRRVYERVRDEEMPPPTGVIPPQRGAVAREKNVPRDFLEALQKSYQIARKLRDLSAPEPASHLIPASATSLQSLQIQRRNAAAMRVEVVRNQYELAKVKAEVMLEAMSSFLEAELELAQSDADRLAILRRQLAIARECEDMGYSKYHGGAGGLDEHLRLKEYRLATQVELQRCIEK